MRKSRLVKVGLLMVAGMVVAGVAWYGSRDRSSPHPTAVSSTLILRPVAVAPDIYLLALDRLGSAD